MFLVFPDWFCRQLSDLAAPSVDIDDGYEEADAMPNQLQHYVLPPVKEKASQDLAEVDDDASTQQMGIPDGYGGSQFAGLEDFGQY